MRGGSWWPLVYGCECAGSSKARRQWLWLSLVVAKEARDGHVTRLDVATRGIGFIRHDKDERFARMTASLTRWGRVVECIR